MYVCGILQNWSLYPHTLMYCHGTWTQWSLGRVTHVTSQTWGQRSSRGQWPLVQVFGKKGQCIHILWCIFKSNITMIAKVCDCESSRDTWFENRLVLFYAYIISRHIGNWIKQKKIKRKLLPKLLISRILTFNISATVCSIQIIFSVLESVDWGL